MHHNKNIHSIVISCCLLLCQAAQADSIQWTGTNIVIVGSTAQITVDLKCSLDSAPSGKIQLRLQTDTENLDAADDDPGRDEVAIKAGDQTVRVSKHIRLLSGQKQLQVWTPLFPEGASRSPLAPFQIYDLKKTSDNKMFAVAIDMAKHIQALNQLVNGVENGDLAMVSSAFANGANVEERDKYGLSMLQSAAASGYSDILKLLLNNGANVNRQGPEGYTALMLGVSKRHLDCVRLLLEHGADPNLKMEGVTAIVFAAGYGDIEMVELLLKKNAQPNASLAYAIAKSQDKMVMLLIERGADVNLKNEDGVTALMTAAGQNLTNMARLLLDKGADMEIGDKDGDTALWYAVINENIAATKLLVQKGAKIDTRNQKNQTPLMSATVSGNDEIAKFLIDKGANVNATDNDGDTVLFYALAGAIVTENASTLKLIIQNHADVNVRNNRGKTPLETTQGSMDNTFGRDQLGFIKEIEEMLRKAGAKE